jgi:hypothetical protein
MLSTANTTANGIIMEVPTEGCYTPKKRQEQVANFCANEDCYAPKKRQEQAVDRRSLAESVRKNLAF